MKKIFVASALLFSLVALASCGTSKKYGCPSTAKTSTQISVKV